MAAAPFFVKLTGKRCQLKKITQKKKKLVFLINGTVLRQKFCTAGIRMNAAGCHYTFISAEKPDLSVFFYFYVVKNVSLKNAQK
ncbi:hypothetical protein [Paenibacillus xylanivorans]|uniref:Uncharacterized protein n=1 Tax=Paenibacillus xylanivorans TaxID=1705561 RepID=A0A0M9BLM1_9BACL|nr:hypothetical protein [Paenibacillus xylanivorans]KOY14778.1 hypothetical protein AMS66_19800 [Paenibacillus xylanivorans]